MDIIEQVRWHPYRIPLKREFVTAHGGLAVREGAIVEVITTSGVKGVGEIAPLPAFGGESLATMLTVLPALALQLRGRTVGEGLRIVEAMWRQGDVGQGDVGQGDVGQGDRKGRHDYNEGLVSPVIVVATLAVALPHMPHIAAPVLCGLEIALLDALGKSIECGLSAVLAGDGAEPRPGVWVNAVVGADTTGAAVASAKAAAARGFRCVKLKVGREQDISREIEHIAAVREAIGPGVHLRLDANEAWSLQQAMTILSRCAQFDIQYVEQPVRADDLDALRVLRRAAIVPIAIDESLARLEDAYRVLDSEAADILIIKPQVLGGLRASLRLIGDAAERGIRSVVTSAIEAGIGLVAALHLAAAARLTLECGLATLDMLEDDLLIDDLPIQEGFLAVPGGVGLGVQLDRDALERYVLGRHR